MHWNIASEDWFPHRHKVISVLNNNRPLRLFPLVWYSLSGWTLHKSKHLVLLPGTNVYVSLIYVVSRAFIYWHNMLICMHRSCLTPTRPKPISVHLNNSEAANTIALNCILILKLHTTPWAWVTLLITRHSCTEERWMLHFLRQNYWKTPCCSI